MNIYVILYIVQMCGKCPAMRGDTWRAGRIEQWLFQWQPRDNRGGEPVVHRHPGSTGQQDHHLLVDGLEAA